MLAISAAACSSAPEGDTTPVEPAAPAGNENEKEQPEQTTGAPGSKPYDGWHILPSIARGPRVGATAVALNGRIAIIGGFDHLAEVVSEIELYDPGTKSWDIILPLPRPLHHVNAAAVAGKLYILGGLEGAASKEIGESYAYFPASGEWHPMTPMPAGTERAGSAVGVIGSKVYIAGGVRGDEPVADFSAYDVEADTWKELPPMPEARGYVVGGAVGGIFYTIGGQKGGSSEMAGDVFAFDPAKGAWSARASMPTPRSDAAAGIVDDRIFVLGGEGDAETETGLFDVNEIYDPATDTWTKGERMDPPRHGVGAAGHDGVLYVAGGATKKLLFGAVDMFEAYIP